MMQGRLNTQWSKLLLNIASALISLLLFREVIRFITSDFVASIIPRWNFTTHSDRAILNIRTSLAVMAALTLFGIFRTIKWLLNLVIKNPKILYYLEPGLLKNY